VSENELIGMADAFFSKAIKEFGEKGFGVSNLMKSVSIRFREFAGSNRYARNIKLKDKEVDISLLEVNEEELEIAARTLGLFAKLMFDVAVDNLGERNAEKKLDLIIKDTESSYDIPASFIKALGR
jgi:hypothetical protein